MRQTHSLVMPVDNENSAAIGSRNRSVVTFFLLTFALAVPFWLIGALTGVELLPGLPIAALMTWCPMIAALILVYREEGAAGAIALLKRSLDFRRVKSKLWYVPTLLLMPAASVLAFGILRLTGTPLPVPQIGAASTLMLGAIFFIGAISEELGWSGYAIEPMQKQWGALRASLVLGVIWCLYHYVALAQAHRSVEWVAWWSVYTLSLRVITLWLYNNTGRSVFITVLFHMTSNVTWQLFPVSGSYWDPRVFGAIMALVVGIILLIWEPRTLARVRAF